tara:strand:- start:80 stop:208 length:129 start_codon:yes stop_codon:yes gene_type:complete
LEVVAVVAVTTALLMDLLAAQVLWVGMAEEVVGIMEVQVSKQ